MLFFTKIYLIKLNNIFRSNTFQRISYSFLSIIISQLITYITLPFASRLYQIDDFGTHALFISASSLISSIGTLQYHYSIFTSIDNSYKSNGVYTALIFSTLICLLVLIIYSIFVYEKVSAYIPVSLPFAYIIFYAFLLNAIVTINFYLNSCSKNTYVSNGRLLNSLLYSALIICFGIQKKDNGLIISLIIATVVQLLYTLSKALPYLSRLDFILVKEIVKDNKNMPLYSLPHSFLDSLKNNVFNFLILHFYGNKILGIYSFSERLVRIPLSVVGTSVSDILFKQMTTYFYMGGDYLKKKIILMYTIVIPCILICMILIPFFIEETIAKIFGAQWLESIPVLYSMIPLGIVWFLGSPISIIPIIAKKQSKFLIYSFTLFSISIFIFYLTSLYSNDFIYSMTLKNIIECILFSFLIIWIIRISNNNN
jgi:O-antigen/teichoic acid export membrane protein